MPTPTSITRSCVVAAMTVGLTVLSSCGRSPDETAPPAESEATEAQEPLIALDLPISNPDLGVTLTAIPPGMVVTYNDNGAIEVTDESRRTLRYTFFAELPDLPTRSPATVADFEIFIGKHHQGQVKDRGTLDTSIGSATWALGTYFEEEQSFEDLRVFIPHPSGTGTLIIAAVGPEGSANLDDRLAVVQKILTFVS